MTDTDIYLSPGEVAAVFGVSVATVRAWNRDGKLAAVRTPGNHRRFPQSAVAALLTATGPWGTQQQSTTAAAA